MAEIARGQISDRPFVRTVHTVAAKRFTGDLTLEHDGVAYKLAWHRGVLVGADVPGASGSLGERATALFGIEEGSFVLDDQSTVVSDPDATPVDSRWLIFHGVMGYYSPVRLASELRALAARPFRIAPDVMTALDAYGLDETDQPWVKRMLERTCTLEELADLDPNADRHRISALVYALLATEALSFEGPAPRLTAPQPVARAKHVSIDPGDTGVTDANQLRQIVSDRVQLISTNADHFQIIGVAPSASSDEIRNQYFALAKMLHPDRVRQLNLGELADPASQVFARVNDAFGAIGDDDKRQAYIAELEGGGGDGDSVSEAQMLAILEAEERFKLGEMALRRAHYSQAIEDFEEAVKLNPEEGEHHAMAAWARWMDTRDKDTVRAEVRKMFRTGIRLSPNNSNVFYYRGKLAVDLDDDEGARYCFERTLELDPKHEPAFKQKRVLDNAIAAKAAQRAKRPTLVERFRK